MQSLQRTNEKFTTGVVNVPQNTPAFLIFNCESSEAYKEATSLLKYHGLSYTEDRKRARVIIKTHKIVHNDYVRLIISQARISFVKRQTPYRYMFFELDDKNADNVLQVLRTYVKYNLPVYYHETMRGYHFFSVKPILDDAWQNMLSEIKQLNERCPMVTLRIRPNKWVGEKPYFERAYFLFPNEKTHDDTQRFASLVTKQAYPLFEKKAIVQNKYLIVNYEQNGEMGNL